MSRNCRNQLVAIEYHGPTNAKSISIGQKRLGQSKLSEHISKLIGSIPVHVPYPIPKQSCRQPMPAAVASLGTKFECGQPVNKERKCGVHEEIIRYDVIYFMTNFPGPPNCPWPREICHPPPHLVGGPVPKISREVLGNASNYCDMKALFPSG